MTAITLTTVDDFARAVRAALADLPADELDDLTDGLEADLAERESDEKSPDFGDPVAYADELRSAAGLPYRRPPSSFVQLGAILQHWREAAANTIRSNRGVAAVIAFLASLRPVWWVYRAWAAFLWFQFGLGSGIHALPVTVGGALVLVPALILSVQLGRDRWMPWAWMRVVLGMINLALIIATPFIAAWALNNSAWGNY
jgi:hypothetical protein